MPIEDRIGGLTWSPDGECIAVGEHLRGVRLWSVETGLPGVAIGVSTVRTTSICWSPTGDGLAAAGMRMQPKLVVWDDATKQQKEIDLDNPVFALAWSPKNNFLVSGLKTGNVFCCDTKTWEQTEFSAHDEEIKSVSFSADGKLLATKSVDGYVCLWRTTDWALMAELLDPMMDLIESSAPVEFSKEGNRLATLGHHGNAIRVWTIDQQALVSVKSTPLHYWIKQPVIEMPPSLIDTHNNGNGFLFAGAGMSASVLRVDSAYLKKLLTEKIRRTYPDYSSDMRTFENVADEFSVIYGNHHLLDYLHDHIPQDKCDSVDHEIAVDYFKCIVTTNWDFLFEQACEAHKYDRLVIDNESAIGTFKPDFKAFEKRQVLKIHGSIDSPANIVATSQQLDTFHLTHHNTLDVITNLLSANPAVFIGYNLAEPHINRILATVRTQKKHLAHKHYAVGKFDKVRKETLSARGFEVIVCDAHTFFEKLTSLL